ncbi:MAG TPA: DNA-directed RNA polymerase subunit beta' [Anaerolineae bacterium]|nr:DNA-directed RNA polymerase subunit beta' [Anaerolineae bacterium]HQK15406.1 DNA-directed RNA polymerase subunit beta' [Anaerolineae bacterium]
MNRDERITEARTFKVLRISLASPEDILSWSYGEVTKPETINYRRLRPEKDGLFCEAIFGPTRDYQCYCGKYKGIRYRGIICDKCGVEVTRNSVRRERLGHITLAAPVAHIWYTRRIPSHLSILLDISKRNLDRVLYFAQYVVTYVDEEARQRALKRIDEEERMRMATMDDAATTRIGELEDRMVQERKQRAALEESIKARFEEELNTRTEKILGEAKRLRDRLDSLMGRQASESIIFAATDTVIVEADEIVSREHYAILNTVAQDALDALELEIHQREAEALKPAALEAAAKSPDFEGDIQHVREELQEKTTIIRSHYDDLREELLSLSERQFFNEQRYRELRQRWGQVFRAGMGAEAIHELLSNLDLDAMAEELWHEVRFGRSAQRRKKATRQLRVVEALRKSHNKPEWMILTVLPVLPPELRPMVQLDGGRFATSDLNDLYRRVINRNNRLKRLLELGAPEVIINNEKRMLQEAVDSLIDNSQRGKAMSRRGRRQLKSLSDMLKGKKGRFRRNLLGKRVDYSGRSVIVVGPDLQIHQCGLPKTMALELYRPFIIQRLVEYNYATNVKAAKRLIERQRPEVWEVLEEVIQDRPVMLNRAPTLHRLGIQAFEPLLVEGKAIQLHPLVCAAFNADFDGDQMAVHVPLSRKAVEEARKLMLASRNLLKPADGQPIIGPSKDMCMGIYYMTMDVTKDTGPVKAFADLDEVEMAYALGTVDIHARIKIAQVYDTRPAPPQMIETTVGRALFNRIVPDPLRYINKPLDKGDLQDLIAVCYRRLGPEAAVDFADAIKTMGFHYATVSGVTISVYDLTVPKEKDEILANAAREVSDIERQYRRGLLTEEEQYNRTIEIWSQAREQVSKAVSNHLDPDGPIAVMARSGASKGGFGPIAQLSGMRGLMADPSGRIIPLPIRSNLREGLNALEYFISTHGSRKGSADTALRTADAGYLTRRLVDTAQDVIINALDCGTRTGIWIRRKDNIGGQPITVRLVGRIAAAPVLHPQTGEVIVDKNQEIDEDRAALINRLEIAEVYVRSPMTCELEHGICAMCYGRDLGRGGLVRIGTAVGIIAAQSIGEPGTQLTLRTFHTGGTALSGGDITSGLPRVEELLEARKAPRGEAEIADQGGVVHIIREGDTVKVSIVDSQIKRTSYDIPEDWEILVEDGDTVNQSDLLARSQTDTTKELRAKARGRIARDGRDLLLIYEIRDEHEYDVPATARLLVAEGQQIEAGTQLYEGVPNPHRILQVQGRDAVQLHLLSEVQQVYRSQGVNISDKHFEIIIRKMLSRVLVTESGDTEYLPGDLVDRVKFEHTNQQLVAEGKAPARARQVLLGLTKAALATDSFLSAASFQHTIKVLSNAAVRSDEDMLYGLKENVIIGKLIPAGTGYRGDIAGSDGPIEDYEGVVIEKELPKGTLLSDEEEEPEPLLLSDLQQPFRI